MWNLKRNDTNKLTKKKQKKKINLQNRETNRLR